MARAKASDSQRRAKPTVADELTHGIAKLRELSTQIDDLSRDGFPYREAGRARTELSFRETIRRLFGEKSPEYQAHKNHKLRVGSRAESAQSTALIKQLIAALENQNADILGLKSASPATPPSTVPERPALTAVLLSSPPDYPVPPTAAVALHSAPPTVSVAMTSNVSSADRATAPVVTTSPPSMNPAPTDTAPVESSQPVHDASMPRQRLSSSAAHSDITQSGPVASALEEKKSVLAPPHQGPDTSTPPAQGSVAASAKIFEQAITTTAVIQTGASHRPVVPQHTVPLTLPASQDSPTASALQTEPLLSLRSVPVAAMPLASTPTPILPPRPVPIESVAPALIEKPPQDRAQASASKRTIETLPTEPPASGPTAAERVTHGAELSVMPQAVEIPSETPMQSNEKETGTLEMLRRICSRFHLVARQLRLRKEYRPTIEITDEVDLQDLFYALLRLQFDEVGTEEWAPGYADGARRTSYLLDWDRVVVVVKQTKSGISTKDLAEQVKSDAAHYATRPNGITLVCFIYDPEGRVGNPRGLEADLTSVSDTYMVEVIVAPK